MAAVGENVGSLGGGKTGVQRFWGCWEGAVGGGGATREQAQGQGSRGAEGPPTEPPAVDSEEAVRTARASARF